MSFVCWLWLSYFVCSFLKKWTFPEYLTMCQTLARQLYMGHLIYLHKTLYNRNHNFSQCGVRVLDSLSNTLGVTELASDRRSIWTQKSGSRDWFQGTKRQKKSQETLHGGGAGAASSFVRVRKEAWAKWWNASQARHRDSGDQWRMRKTTSWPVGNGIYAGVQRGNYSGWYV